MEPEGEDARERKLIRSGLSVDSSFVMFVNGTPRNVMVYWINHNGNRRLYIRLRPKGSVDVNTFKSHAWIFRDARTGERMHIQHEKVFWAQCYTANHPITPDKQIAVRKQFQIHLPVYSLREYMLWYFVRNQKGISEDVVNKWNAPRTVKNDMILVLRQVATFKKTMSYLRELNERM